MFSQLIKLFRVLSSEASPLQVSFGFAMAMIVGLTPLINIHNILVIFLLLIFRINLAAFLLGWAFFSALSYLLDPVFHDLGKSLLNSPGLINLWTELYNSGFWRLSNFNNTIVMGSLAVSLLAYIPLVLLSTFLIKQYRSHVMTRLEKSRIFNLLKSSKLISRAVALSE